MNFFHCLHIVFVIGKHIDVFQGIFFWWMGGVSWWDLSMTKFFVEEGNFPWWESRIFQHYLKTDQKLNNKKEFFSTESKEQH